MNALTEEKLSIHSFDSNFECDSQQPSCIGSDTFSNYSSWSEGPIDENIFIEETNYSKGFCKYLGCDEIINPNKKRKIVDNKKTNEFLDLNEEKEDLDFDCDCDCGCGCDYGCSDNKKSKKYIKKSQLCYNHYRIIYENDNYSGRCSSNECKNNVRKNKRFCDKHYKKFISKNECDKCNKIKFRNDLCKIHFKEFYFCIFKNDSGEECKEKIHSIKKSLCKKHYNFEYNLEKRRERESDIEFVMKKLEMSIEKNKNRKKEKRKKQDWLIKSNNKKITSIFPIIENKKKQ